MSMAFVRGIHRGPVNSPHKWPVTQKMFPFDDVIMKTVWLLRTTQNDFATQRQGLLRVTCFIMFRLYNGNNTVAFKGYGLGSKDRMIFIMKV